MGLVLINEIINYARVLQLLEGRVRAALGLKKQRCLGLKGIGINTGARCLIAKIYGSEDQHPDPYQNTTDGLGYIYIVKV